VGLPICLLSTRHPIPLRALFLALTSLSRAVLSALFFWSECPYSLPLAGGFFVVFPVRLFVVPGGRGCSVSGFLVVLSVCVLRVILKCDDGRASPSTCVVCAMGMIPLFLLCRQMRDSCVLCDCLCVSGLRPCIMAVAATFERSSMWR